jgi:hypothetical protein
VLSKHKNIVFVFLGCAVLYVVLILHYYTDGLRGDEIRYITYAQNLLNGFYSPPAPDFDLWSGPGYPFILMPFIALGFGHFQLVLLNVVFLVGALFFTYKSARLFVNDNLAILITLFLGMYFPISKHIYFVHTECFTWLLVSVILNIISRMIITNKSSVGTGIGLSILLAFLVMVKVVFGYVIIGMAMLLAVRTLIVKRNMSALRPLGVMSLAFVFCIPWLMYTYSITGRTMLWTNCSSLSLYTMSTSYEGEYGDWLHPNILIEHTEHKEFVSRTMTKPALQQFDLYQKQAIENIKNNKLGYAKNWMFNVSRMLSEYPTNKRMNIGLAPLKSLGPLLFLLPLLVYFMFVHFKRRNEVAPEITMALVFVLAYLFGSSLVSAMERMFFITLPFWMIYVAYFMRFTSFSIDRLKRRL